MGYRDNRPPDNDDKYVVERERVVDRQVEQPGYQQQQQGGYQQDPNYQQQPGYQPPGYQQQQGYVPPAYAPQQPQGGQVNVNASTPAYGGGYATTTYSPGPLYYARRVVALLFTVLMALIAIRVVLLLLGANTDNGVVNFVMAATEPFIAPCRGVFQFDQVNPIGRSVLDVGALVALVGYFLLMVLILAILRIADRDANRA